MKNTLTLLLCLAAILQLKAQEGTIVSQEESYYRLEKPWKKTSPKKADFKETITKYSDGFTVEEKLRLEDNQLIYQKTYEADTAKGVWKFYNKSKGLIAFNVDSIPKCEPSEKSKLPQEEIDSILAQRTDPVYRESIDNFHNEFFSELVRSIRYPAFAKDNAIQGTVILGFTIDKTGTIKDICIKEGVHWALDLEAYRALLSMNDFAKPAMEQGKPIAYQMTVPLNFNLR